MNLPKRILAAIRTLLNDPERVRTIMVPARRAGVVVDHETALTTSAYFRAVSYIAASVAGLPWEVIRETLVRTVKLVNHPVWDLLQRRPNYEMGQFTWREIMVAWALTWGNAVSEIEFDVSGRPIGLWPLSPDRVSVKRGRFQNGGWMHDDSGDIFYVVSNYSGGTSYLPAGRVFHLHGLGFDGLQGYSIISLAARSLGLSLAAERYGEDYFANGAVAAGAVEVPKTLTADAYDRLKQDLNENHVKFGQKFSPLIFEQGSKWNAMALPNKDSQILETREFQIQEICRWTGLPPHKLAELTHATFSNIEELDIEVVNDALMPWIYRLEEEADIKLFTGREQAVRTKINIRGLMRGKDKDRAEYYKTLREIGVYSTNTILRLEDLDPVGPEGDELLVPLNYTTLKRMVSGEAQPPKNPQQVQASYVMLLQDSFLRILRRESNRFEQNRHKFEQNGSFLEWVSELCSQQRDYMTTALEPILTSLLLLCMPNIHINGDLSRILGAAIDGHLERTRRSLEEISAGREATFEIEDRAKQEALDLIERVFASFAGRNSHGTKELQSVSASELQPQ